MRPSDRRVFREAAMAKGLWILVRRTNPASLPYIGLPGYAPKPIECKAKTANGDDPPYRLAGLVVDPTIHPSAFRKDRIEKARSIWQEFARKHGLDGPAAGGTYAVDRDRHSKHYGCLMLDGCYLHGDYDLYDIIDPTHPRGNLAAIETLRGEPHMRGPWLVEVMRFVNGRIGVDMLQHGGEAQYADHSEQSVDAFGPEGQDCTILNEYSVRKWYEGRFEGRRPIDTKAW